MPYGFFLTKYKFLELALLCRYLSVQNTPGSLGVTKGASLVVSGTRRLSLRVTGRFNMRFTRRLGQTVTGRLGLSVYLNILE